MMKKHIYKFLGFMLALLAGSSLMANNIAISNLSLTGKNTTGHFTLVQFDISWENSWRTSSVPNNWDAAWVFVKYRKAGGEWNHAWLNENGHTAPAGSIIMPGLVDPGSAFNATTNPGLGAFIYRSADGTGPFTNTGVQLRWNYGANGLTDADVAEIKVFAIEMVYVPQGSFYAGSGGSENDAFYKFPTAINPFQVTSENAINVGTTADYLSYPNNSNGGDRVGPIPAAFPKGYGSFYCQKYEISQQQYVDFLNTLTQTQATARKYDEPNPGYRYEITGGAVGSYAAIYPYVACNFLTWMDGAAYSDWAGLRPMTELEYEKACRGTATPVANEYAWGTTSVAASAYTLNNAAETGEGISTNFSTTVGNAGYVITNTEINGPLRVGIFAANGSNTGRETAGASYYGIMELSGNLWERAVTVGKPEGRAFTGLHGNGVLSIAGHADVAAWPGLSDDEVTGAVGSGYRGGSWGNEAVYMRTSDRLDAAYTYIGRHNYSGFRAVRTQPLPALTTTTATAITAYTASSGGNVTSDGGATITARGVCWSTTTGPTIALTTKTTETGTTGEFTSNLINLTASTQYYVRAYATNSAGTSYGNEVSFTTTPFVCGTSTISDIENNTYNTVLIGEQCWIKENLKVTKKPAGTAITRYCYEGNATNCDTYGGLYTWDVMMNGAASSNTNPSGVQGICPTGWHIPGDAEWTQLTTFLGGTSVAGGKMKETGTLHWDSPNEEATNESGFTGLPGGYRNLDGTFKYIGSLGDFWSSTQESATYAFILYLYIDAYAYHSNGTKGYGFSVRCVRDSYMPRVTTTAATSITSSTATSGGNVTDAGEYPITARGVCWSTTTGPTISLTTKTTETGTTGEFTSNLINLTASTQYYVRAYATSNAGTAYGNEVSFTTAAPPFLCGTSTITDIDNNTYNTVLIGEQCWMKENLKVTKNPAGMDITRYCWADVSTECDTYGGLYDWDVMMNGAVSSNANPSGVQGICPTGWHIPGDAEWTQLTTFLGGTSVAGGKMKETGTLHWDSPNEGANNSSGFTGLPGGFRVTGYPFANLNYSGHFWSSTETYSDSAWYQWMAASVAFVERHVFSKGYGASVRCLRDSYLPRVTTTAATSITSSTATSGGNVTDAGEYPITARGVCWSTTTGPTISLTTKTTETGTTGVFSSNLTNLAASTQYYVRAYATNSAGTAYGDEVSFTTAVPFVCGTSTIADIDNNTYNTVLIGEQCWMAENLNTGSLINGSGDQTNNGIIEKYCYGNSEAYCDVYGGLYQWDEMMNGAPSSDANPSGVQGICPNGWHIPGDAEWTQLGTFLGVDPGGKMKETETSHWSSPNLGATNSSGFTALPGAFRYTDGTFYNVGLIGDFWSSTQASTASAWNRYLGYYSANLNPGNYTKNFGYSVRCVRDSYLPRVTTTAATSITSSTATSGGNVTDAGEYPVTARGVCWSTTTEPTANLTSKTTEDGTTGEFTSNLTNLNASTLYYVRAYATNSAGTSYGNEVSFTTSMPPFVCGTSTITDIDNNTYNTVLIGEQCWMKENLKVTKNPAGTAITRYCYEGNATNCDTYGGLYDWYVMMNGAASSNANPSGVQGICPTGWHIPGDAEWTQLTTFLGVDPGGKMKETGTSHWSSPNEGATNASGFTGLPGGFRYTVGSFSFIGIDGYFWSSTQYSSALAWNRLLGYDYAYLNRSNYTKGYGFSVRCVRD